MQDSFYLILPDWNRQHSTKQNTQKKNMTQITQLMKHVYIYKFDISVVYKTR
jgi:hypothetical protein